MFTLVEPNEEFDVATKQCLEIIFGSFAIVTKRMLHEHLKGGKYDSPSEELKMETNGVLKINTISECDIGILDCLIRKKPNANTSLLKPSL